MSHTSTLTPTRQKPCRRQIIEVAALDPQLSRPPKQSVARAIPQLEGNKESPVFVRAEPSSAEPVRGLACVSSNLMNGTHADIYGFVVMFAEC